MGKEQSGESKALIMFYFLRLVVSIGACFIWSI